MARTDRTAALGETMSAEETSLLDADKASERDAPESAPEPEQIETAPETDKQSEVVDETPETPEQVDIDPDTGKQRKVNYGALHEEREKRRASEAREREASQKLAKLEGRFDVLQNLAQKSQQPPAPTEQPIEIPDINVDPVGHFQAKDMLREREMSELRAWKQAQDQQSQVRNNVARIQELAQAHEAEFAKTTPDYEDAFKFLRQSRNTELEAMGYLDAGVRNQIITQDAIQIAAQALQTNRNAAEAVYNIAKARGFQGKAQAPAPAPVIPKPATPHPDTVKLQNVAKGQETAGSLGQVNGSAPADKGVRAVLEMSDDEFAATYGGEKGEANWRKLMGG